MLDVWGRSMSPDLWGGGPVVSQVFAHDQTLSQTNYPSSAMEDAHRKVCYWDKNMLCLNCKFGDCLEGKPAKERNLLKRKYREELVNAQ